MSLLVIDVGTSSVRAMAIDDDGEVLAEVQKPCLPSSPAGGLVEFDAAGVADLAIAVARRVQARLAVEARPPVRAVGVANQRASTVVWDAASGKPVGPGLGWQDLRTVGRCLELQASGHRLAPNMSATKAEWLIGQTDVPADRLRVGTIDSWLAWHLTGGSHVTDATNAAVTGLAEAGSFRWDGELLDALGIPASAMPAIVPTIGELGPCAVLDGAPPLTALVGDQQASLVGQGCVTPGAAKITFGTGAMLDVVAGPSPVPTPDAATFPIIAWRTDDGVDTFGIEAVMLSAGTCVEWLRDGLGMLGEVADAAAVAGEVGDTEGVVFVPALSGLGSPVWDHGARGLLIGLTRGTTRAHIVRAVLEGVAQRGVDLIEAATAAVGSPIEHLSVDGGMTANPVFVQALADAAQRPITVSSHREATAFGAGLLAGVGAGVWASIPDAATVVAPGATVEPMRHLDRAAFARARDRAASWIPELSTIVF